MLVRGEALRHFDTLYAEVWITTPENLTYIILGLGTYFFLVNVRPKKKRDMRHVTRKPPGLKVRCYASHIVDLNKYLDFFPGAKESDLFLWQR